MNELPKNLADKLRKRKDENALRSLPQSSELIDFSSNDYLGFSKNQSIASRVTSILEEHHVQANGATGSRLLTGDHILYPIAEALVSRFHESEAALIFNSGYDANIGFFQSVPQRGDFILYDEYIHASIRDGIQMSLAKGYKFQHNTIANIKAIFSRLSTDGSGTVYLVTESVFSMDGDSPDLIAIAQFCKENDIYLIVDEAHAIGVIGSKGQGLVQKLGLQHEVFARVITFGKALGAHGAAILSSEMLKQYLVNFARSFIYTTGLPPHAVATIIASYEKMNSTMGETTIAALKSAIEIFNLQPSTFHLQSIFIPSTSAIHSAVIPGNKKVKTLSRKLKQQGYDVKPILSPTVPEGQERLRFCLHSFNSEVEIKSVVSLMATLLDNENNA